MSAIPFVPNWAAALAVGAVVLLYPRFSVARGYWWNLLRGRDADDVAEWRAWAERLAGVVLVAYGVSELVAPMLSGGGIAL